jgi:hypothetical protein
MGAPAYLSDLRRYPLLRRFTGTPHDSTLPRYRPPRSGFRRTRGTMAVVLPRPTIRRLLNTKFQIPNTRFQIPNSQKPIPHFPNTVSYKYITKAWLPTCFGIWNLNFDFGLLLCSKLVFVAHNPKHLFLLVIAFFC